MKISIFKKLLLKDDKNSFLIFSSQFQFQWAQKFHYSELLRFYMTELCMNCLKMVGISYFEYVWEEMLESCFKNSNNSWKNYMYLRTRITRIPILKVIFCTRYPSWSILYFSMDRNRIQKLPNGKFSAFSFWNFILKILFQVVQPINKLIETTPFDIICYSLDWHPQNHISFVENVAMRQLDPSSMVSCFKNIT